MSETNIEKLVDAILSRIQQHRVTYEHLENSYSIVHSKFIPFSQETFNLLSKIVQEAAIPQHIVNRILADPVVARRIFQTKEMAEEILTRRLEMILESEPTSVSHSATLLQTLPLASKLAPTPTTQKLISQIVTKTINDLSTNSATLNAPIPDILHLNSCLLDAISLCSDLTPSKGLVSETNSLKEMYLQKLPFQQIIDSILLSQVKNNPIPESPFKKQIEAMTWS